MSRQVHEVAMEPNDTYECYRVEQSNFANDGCPYFLTVVNDEASMVKHRWDLNFSTYDSAFEGARALVASGKYFKVYINETRYALKRA